MADLVRIGLVIDDTGAAAAITRTESGIKRVGLASVEGSKGINKIERSLSVLAFQAAGVPGPVGSLSTALLQFGTGGIVTLSVVAGLGAMVGAYKLLETESMKTATRVAEASKKIIESTKAAILAPGEAAAAKAQAIGYFQANQPLADSLFPKRSQYQGLFQNVPDPLFNADINTKALLRLRLGGYKPPTDTYPDLSQEFAGGAAQFLRSTSAFQFGAPGFPAFGSATFGKNKTLSDADSLDFEGALRGSRYSDPKAARRMDTAGYLNLAASGIGLAAGATGGGNAAGSFLMGAGGLVSAVPGGQIAGAGIMLLGAIVSLFKKPLKVEDDKVARALAKQFKGPDYVSVNILGNGSRESYLYDLKRLSRQDAIVRVPTPRGNIGGGSSISADSIRSPF